jgi:hypothetical protein
MFKDGRTNVHDKERSGRPSVMSDDLVQSVDQKILERRRFTISELWCEFTHVSRTVLYEIITNTQDRFNNNEEMMEGVETWLSSMAADFFGTGIQNLFPDTTNASIQAVTTLRSSLNMYLFSVYNHFFSHCLFF